MPDDSVLVNLDNYNALHNRVNALTAENERLRADVAFWKEAHTAQTEVLKEVVADCASKECGWELALAARDAEQQNAIEAESRYIQAIKELAALRAEVAEMDCQKTFELMGKGKACELRQLPIAEWCLPCRKRAELKEPQIHE